MRKLHDRIEYKGIPISVENTRGTVRRGVDPDGNPWATLMQHSYGYIRGTLGVDGDEVDVFVGPHFDSDVAFIVHQKNPDTGAYDEDKVILGTESRKEAERLYRLHYDNPDRFLGEISTVLVSSLPQLLASRRGNKLRKALVQIQLPVSRRGKTFMQRFWVSPEQARKMLGQDKGKVADNQVVPGEPRTGKSFDANAIVTGKKIVEFAPDSENGVRKAIDMQRAIYGDQTPSLEDIRETAANELEEALKSENTGQGWYREKMNSTRAVLMQTFSSLADDNEWALFGAILATTSPNNPVQTNMDSAIKIWAIYKESGHIPLKQPSGKNWPSPAADKALNRLKGVLEKSGPSGVAAWMSEEVSGREILELNPSAKEIRKDDTYPRARMFGPKVGTFYTNLMGDFSNATVDKWTTRSWRRWNNDLKIIIDKKRDAEGNLIESEISNEFPGAVDRRNVQSLFEGLGEEFNMDVADVQAVLWYYEKRLWGSIGASGKISEEIDYETAARRAFENIIGEQIDEERVAIDTKTLDARRSGEARKSLGGRGEAPIFPAARDGNREGGARKMNVTLTLQKSKDDGAIHITRRGRWFYRWGGKAFDLVPSKELAKSLLMKAKRYYSPDEVRAMGMRWVTINGARVLLQGSGDGWVVVGGADGNLNHFKVDRVLSKDDYESRRKEREKQKKKAEIENIGAEEYYRRQRERTDQRKARNKARREARGEYMKRLENAMGSSLDEMITSEERESIRSRAEKLASKTAGAVSHKKNPPVPGVWSEGGESTPSEKEDGAGEQGASARPQGQQGQGVASPEDVDKVEARLLKNALKQKVAEIEQEAMRVMAAQFTGEIDPVTVGSNADVEALMDVDTATRILNMRDEYKKTLQMASETSKTGEDEKVGITFAGEAEFLNEDVEKEIRDNIETAKNIEFYSEINAHHATVSKYMSNGTSRALNGILSDVYGSGAVFDEQLVKELGVEPMARALAHKLTVDGKDGLVRKALSDHSREIREKTVDAAMSAYQKAKREIERIREGSKGDLAYYSGATANGVAIRHYAKAYNELGSAAGSLRAMAHLYNALGDPPNENISIGMGRDKERALRRMQRAGFPRDSYSLRMDTDGTYRVEIPSSEIVPMLDRSAHEIERNAHLDSIKRYEQNTGEVAPGVKAGNRWGFNPKTGKVDKSVANAQEAGYRYARDKKRCLLDFLPGIGKTFCAANLIADAMKTGEAKRILYVAPATLRKQGEKELQKFLDPELASQVKQVSNLSKDQRYDTYLQDGIHIVSQTALQNDAEGLAQLPFDMVIADEVHQMVNAKASDDSGSRQFKSFKRLSDQADSVVAMTGTPIKTHKREAWRIAELIGNSESIGRMAEFESRHEGVNQNTSAFRNSEMEAIRQELGTFTFSQGYSLSVKKNREAVEAEPTRDQRAEIKRVYDDYAQQQARYAEAVAPYREAGAKVPSEVRRLMPNTGKRDADLWRATYLTGGKQNSVYRVVSDQVRQVVDRGEKGLLFLSQGASREGSEQYARMLNEEFGPGTAAAVNSAVKPNQIERLKARINDPEDPLRFLVGTETLSTGHNLQGAHNIIKVDTPISKAQSDQQDARAYRNGQDRDVNIIEVHSNDPDSINKRFNYNRKSRESELMGNPAAVAGRSDSGFGQILWEYEQGIRE